MHWLRPWVSVLVGGDEGHVFNNYEKQKTTSWGFNVDGITQYRDHELSAGFEIENIQAIPRGNRLKPRILYILMLSSILAESG